VPAARGERELARGDRKEGKERPRCGNRSNLPERPNANEGKNVKRFAAQEEGKKERAARDHPKPRARRKSIPKHKQPNKNRHDTVATAKKKADFPRLGA